MLTYADKQAIAHAYLDAFTVAQEMERIFILAMTKRYGALAATVSYNQLDSETRYAFYAKLEADHALACAYDLMQNAGVALKDCEPVGVL